MLIELIDKLLAEVNDVLLPSVLRFKEVVVDEVGLVDILFKLIKLLLRFSCPTISVLKQSLRHSLHALDLILDKCKVLLKDCFCFLFLDFEDHLQLIKLLLQVVL